MYLQRATPSCKTQRDPNNPFDELRLREIRHGRPICVWSCTYVRTIYWLRGKRTKFLSTTTPGWFQCQLHCEFLLSRNPSQRYPITITSQLAFGWGDPICFDFVACGLPCYHHSLFDVGEEINGTVRFEFPRWERQTARNHNRMHVTKEQQFRRLENL